MIYVGGYTSSPDFPVTALAAQPRLNGSTNGFLCAIEVRSGKLLYSTYLGGSGNDSVTAVSMAGDGTIYFAGTTNSERWPNVELAGFGNGGATDGFVIKLDPKGKLRPVGVRIGGSGNEVLAAIDLVRRAKLSFGHTELLRRSGDFSGDKMEKKFSGLVCWFPLLKLLCPRLKIAPHFL